MSPRIGIGVITYNRKEVVLKTVEQIRLRTRQPFTLVVADDGSTDGTIDELRRQKTPTVTGANRGIAWNKNRALFWLTHIKNCDAILLLEDDIYPNRDDWEKDWVEAALRWGHVNFAGEWFKSSFIGGSGTVDDPIRSLDVSGQCSSFSRAAILFGGFLDTRFQGFGFEHVEHSLRLMRLGFGGRLHYLNDELRTIYYLLKSDMTMGPTVSHSNNRDVDKNRALCHELLRDASYRAAARDETEMRCLRDEIKGCLTELGASQNFSPLTSPDSLDGVGRPSSA